MGMGCPPSQPDPILDSRCRVFPVGHGHPMAGSGLPTALGDGLDRAWLGTRRCWGCSREALGGLWGSCRVRSGNPLGSAPVSAPGRTGD